MIIAFCGCSGSGKSTLVHRVKRLSYFKNRKVIVQDEDNFLLIRILKFFLGKKHFSEYNRSWLFDEETKEFKARLFSFFVYLFYPLVVYLEFFFNHLQHEVFFKQRVVFRDRYIYDYLVAFERNLGIINKATEWWLERFPRPYLLFFVNISKKTVLERNKHNIQGAITSEVSFHEKTLKSYLKLAEKKKMIFIDNNGSLKSSVKQIKSHILNKEKLAKVKRVTISGLDGVGKSTLAQSASDYLRKLNIPCHVAHFYHEPILFRMLKGIGFFKKSKPVVLQYAESRKRSIKVKKKGKPFIWAALHYLDSYLQYLFFITIYRDRFLIFDRFFYDFWVSFGYLNIRRRSLFEKFVPFVKNRVLLVNQPRIVYERKPENTLQFFKFSHKAYLKIARKYKMQVIDTYGKAPNAILEEFLKVLS